MGDGFNIATADVRVPLIYSVYIMSKGVGAPIIRGSNKEGENAEINKMARSRWFHGIDARR